MDSQLPYPRILGICAIISLLIHFVILLVAWKLDRFDFRTEDPISSIQLRLVDSSKLPVVDTFQEASEEKPKDAKFSSDRNLTAETETSPLVSPIDIPSGRAGSPSEKPRETQKTEKLPKKKKVESFSLSKDELVAMNDPFVGSGANRNSDLLSPGFIEHLQLGEELKLNALGLDYGQYIVRMRERLAQRWNPRRTIRPEMYDYDVIEVVLGIVLNDNGELVDMKVIKTSFFPEYDEEAKQTFRDSGPFPNPPDSLIQEDGKVYMPWAFSFHFHGFGAGEVY